MIVTPLRLPRLKILPLKKIKKNMKLAEERNSNVVTNTRSNSQSDNDTAIYFLGADNARGGVGANEDELVMVLEDYDSTLVFGHFTLIATDGV